MIRTRWEIVPRPGVFAWAVIYNGAQLRTFLFRYAAESYAEFLSAQNLAEKGELSEIVVKGRDGKTQDARRIGDDPPHSLG